MTIRRFLTSAGLGAAGGNIIALSLQGSLPGVMILAGIGLFVAGCFVE